MLEGIFLSILEVSMTTSVVILIILLIAPIFQKRYAMKWKYLIWIFLALRLILPFDIADIGHGIEKLAAMNADVPQSSAFPAGSDGEGRAAGQRIVVEIPEQVTRPIMLQSEAAPSKLTILMVAAWIWIAGAFVFLSVHIVSYLHYKRQVMKRGRRIKDTYILQQLYRLCRELKIRQNIHVVQYRETGSPMVIGLSAPSLFCQGRIMMRRRCSFY